MIFGKKIVVVMPAYNAEKTLRSVYQEIPLEYVDDVILVDDASIDHTSDLSLNLGIRTIRHPINSGYGANQKSCYRKALELGADVVIMLHPDYQYTPKLLVSMGALVANGQYDIVLGSRILGGGAIQGGMPYYKYVTNRILTWMQNIVTGAKLSEYHTGYRAFSRQVLLSLPLLENSNDFVFDNQMLLQALYFGYSIGEISCPTRYFEDASSINFTRGVKYGFGVLTTTIVYFLERLSLYDSPLFSPFGRKME